MRVFLTGTDTGVGKTVTAAWLMLHSDASYWKPIQAGLEGETDEQTVRRLTGLGDGRFHPGAYALTEPLSPHEAAQRNGVEIDTQKLRPPPGPLVVEGAGGLMVPLNANALMIDLIQQFALPVIMVARTSLGTINHTLLSLEALRRRNIEVAGVVLCGADPLYNRDAIETYGKVRILGHLPVLQPMIREALLAVTPQYPLGKL